MSFGSTSGSFFARLLRSACERFIPSRFGGSPPVDIAVARVLRLCGMSMIEPRNESLSQRELRNESGRVLREVSEGHSFVLTNSGVPVGRIVPIDAPAPALTIARSAKREGGWAALAIERKTATRSLAETLDDLRGDRL